MHINYIPYLKSNEFEEVYTPKHFHTGNDFFTIQRSKNIYDSTRKYLNYNDDNSSEFSHIIPQNTNFFDSRKKYTNNYFLETKELSPNHNCFYSSKNIFLDDMHYQKYLLHLNIEGSNSKIKKINKKNNSQNKNVSNQQTYNIIQIYEAPPLELTPISENEKNEFEIKRKPPKYYRKKKIYSLEDKKENKNKLFDLDYNELEKIRKKYENKNLDSNCNYNNFLKHTKLTNSKPKNKTNNESVEKKEKNYLRYLSKDDKNEVKISDNNININYKKYIRKESQNKINDNNNCNTNDNKEEKDKEKNKGSFINNTNNNIIKKDYTVDKGEKKLYIKSENKSFIQKQKSQINQKINEKIENEQTKNRPTVEQKDIKENNKNNINNINSINNLNSIKIINREQLIKDKDDKKKINEKKDKDKEDKEKDKKNIQIKKNEKNKENNNINGKNEERLKRAHNTFGSKEKQKIIYKIDNNINVEEKPLIKNLLYNKNTNPPIQKYEEEKKDKKKIVVQKEKDNKIAQTAQQIASKSNLIQNRIQENNKKIIDMNKEVKKEKNNILLNIEVDKTQLSSNKRTYLYSKVEKDKDSSLSNAKTNKINKESQSQIRNKPNKYSKKYIYSFSVEKNKEEKNERENNHTERKAIERNNDKTKKNEIKNDTDINKSATKQSKSMTNRNIISNKNEGINKNDNQKINEKKIIKENSNIGFYENNKNIEVKKKYLTNPNPIQQDKNIVEESKNNDASSNRKSLYIKNNSSNNNNKVIEGKKNYSNIAKENNNNSNIKNINNNDKKENNLTTIINATHKNNYWSNHNYVAVKSSGPKKVNNITQLKPIKIEKQETITNEIKKINSTETKNPIQTKNDTNILIYNSNKNEQKPIISRDNNRRLTNDINNNTTNSSNINQNNINNYQVLRAPSVKSVDVKTPNNNNSAKRKNNINQNQNYNHYMKASYGVNTFKLYNEKKENENKITNTNLNNNINNNKNNELNVVPKIIINNNNNSNIINNNNKINTSTNNDNNENAVNVNNNNINIKNNRREVRPRNNHSLYVSIASKK